MHIVCLFIFDLSFSFDLNPYILNIMICLAVEMFRMKRLSNFLETCTLLIQQKITEKVGLYKPGFHYKANATTTTQNKAIIGLSSHPFSR